MQRFIKAPDNVSCSTQVTYLSIGRLLACHDNNLFTLRLKQSNLALT